MRGPNNCFEADLPSVERSVERAKDASRKIRDIPIGEGRFGGGGGVVPGLAVQVSAPWGVRAQITIAKGSGRRNPSRERTNERTLLKANHRENERQERPAGGQWMLVKGERQKWHSQKPPPSFLSPHCFRTRRFAGETDDRPSFRQDLQTLLLLQIKQQQQHRRQQQDPLRRCTEKCH